MRGSPAGGPRRPGYGRSDGSRARAVPEPRRAPEKIGDFMDAFLEGQGVKQQVERVSVLDEWAERVGPKIAEVTRARSVSEATLFVEVRSSAWLMELNMIKGRILERLNEDRDAGALEKLVFVLSQDG